MASDNEKAGFCKKFLLLDWKTVLNIVWIRSRNRSLNWNQNIPKVGTGTAANYYGSTTL
jgi:hypothetical protein